jgi:hypothetical protein
MAPINRLIGCSLNYFGVTILGSLVKNLVIRYSYRVAFLIKNLNRTSKVKPYSMPGQMENAGSHLLMPI